MKIVVDGNIGSGKTTQLDILEEKGWTVKREPLDEWPLDQFYKDPHTWGYILQMAILETLQPIEGTAVYERCLYSTRDVFWRHLAAHVYTDPLITKLYHKQVDHYMWQPDVYIYLRKDPATAYRHIQARGQAGDFGVTLEYLKELDEYYEDMVKSLTCPVYVIDSNDSCASISRRIQEILLSHTN